MDVYAGLLAAALEDELVTPEENERLAAYRTKHNISQKQHNEALAELGWSMSLYSAKLRQGVELDAYKHVLSLVLADERVEPEEEERLDAYRTKHGVTQAMHHVALEQLGLTDAQFLSKFAKATPAAMEEYRELIRRALDDAQVSEVEELKLLEHRRRHHVTDEQHAQALADVGVSAAEFERRRVDVLGAQLQAASARNAERRQELAGVMAELAALQAKEDEQLMQLAASSAEATREERLRTQLEGSEEELARLRQSMRARNSKLRSTQELLDEREAEVYELEEQVRHEEARVASRDDELRSISAELASVEGRVREAQRQLARLEASAADPEASDSLLGFADHDDEEEGWLQNALLKRSQVARQLQADYVCFHTVCMGLKLGLSTPAAHARADKAAGEPQLRNVRIDELWQEVQAERVPPSEWRAYVRRKLVRKSEGPQLDGAEKLLRTLGKIGDSLGDEMKKLGDSLGGKVEELFAGDPAPLGARPGGKAGAGTVRA